MRECGESPKRMWLLCVIALMLLTGSCGRNVTNIDRLGEFDTSQGDFVAAIEDYDKALRLNPHDVDAYIGRGYAYQRTGQPARAIQDYTSAIAEKPGDAMLYVIRGRAFALARDNEGAISDFTRAIELDPGNREALYSRAEAYGAGGARDRALKDYQQAARLGHQGARDYLRSQGLGW